MHEMGLSRADVLSALDPRTIAALPAEKADHEQLRSDLVQLMRMGETPDGRAPLLEVLQNARSLAGLHPRSAVLEWAIALVAGAGRGEPPPGLNLARGRVLDLRGLLTSAMPEVLTEVEESAHPVLVRTGIPTHLIQDAGSLDQWASVCKWLATSGTPGLVYALHLIRDIQATSFSESLSRLAAGLIEAIRVEASDQSVRATGVQTHVRALAAEEAARWGRIQQEVERWADLSDLARAHVAVLASAWARMAAVLPPPDGQRLLSISGTIDTAQPDRDRATSVLLGLELVGEAANTVAEEAGRLRALPAPPLDLQQGRSKIRFLVRGLVATPILRAPQPSSEDPDQDTRPSSFFDGIVHEQQSTGIFLIISNDGLGVRAVMSGRLRQRYLKIHPGDLVTVEVSPHDETRGRIVSLNR